MHSEEYFYTARDGFKIYVKRCTPDDGNVRGVVQFIHGMLEYSGRYENLAQFFTEKGFAFCCFDIRGHGKTAEFSEKNGTGLFGKIADKNGFLTAEEDLYEMVLETKKSFPGKKVFILSYSFGSFVTQRFMQEHGNSVSGCVLCGTNGPQQIQNSFLIFITGLLCLGGRDRKIAFVEELVSNLYIRHLPGKHTCNLDWMCTLKEDIETYLADPWCYFRETIGFHHDMEKGNVHNHSLKNLRKVPENLPVLFVYGKEDPVGCYGKKIQKLISLLKKTGVKDVSYNAYERGGHEILKEYCSFQVWSDILSWMITRC